MQKFKRILAAGLTLAMLLSVMPVGAFAEEVPEAVETTAPEITEAIEETTAPVETTEPAVETTAPAETTEPTIPETSPETTAPPDEQTAPALTIDIASYAQLKEDAAMTTTLKSGKCGPDLEWTYDQETQALAITGSGPMYEYDFSTAPWRDFTVSSVSFSGSITRIGAYAFSQCSGLTNIVIPNTVTQIGDFAFYSSEHLKRVELSSNLKTIGSTLFAECPSIEEIRIDESNPSFLTDSRGALYDKAQTKLIAVPSAITGAYVIPNGVDSIAGEAFFACSGLTSIVIPDTVMSIGDAAFYYCAGLTKIELPQNLVNMGTHVFSLCENLKSVNIPKGIMEIRMGTFNGCENLKEILIPSNIMKIGDSAFNGCMSLTKIDIPDSVQSIEDGAFSFCEKLSEISISSRIQTLGRDLFRQCCNLKKVYFRGCAPEISDDTFSSVQADVYYPAEDTSWDSSVMLDYGGKLSWNAVSALESEKCGDNVYWEFSNGTLTISGSGDMDDYDWNTMPWYPIISSITNVIIKSGVTSIGSHAFHGCSSLNSISIPSSVDSIGYYAFGLCESLTSVTIPSGVTTISDAMFKGCTKLRNVVIPSSVTSIGEGAFHYCDLPSITIPNRVTTIGRAAFAECAALTEVHFDGTKAQWAKISIADSNNELLNTRLICTDYEEPEFDQRFPCGENVTAYYKDGTLTIMGSGEMEHYGRAPWYSICENIKTVVIGSGVSSIGSSAFSNCINLTSAAIADSVTTIGDSAFYNCTSLTSISIPNSVTSIWEGAFYGCSSLTSVAIPDGITSIEKGTFNGCSRLTNVTVPESVTSIGSGAFGECPSLAEVYYNGPRDKWERITYGFSNECFRYANIYCTETGTCGNDVRWELKGHTLTISGTGPMADYDFGSTAYIETPWYEMRDQITTVVIEPGVTNVGKYAFFQCENLTGITIPDGVTRIEDNAFFLCRSLTDVTIPEGVCSIGKYAFEYCGSMTSVVIPTSITSIGSYAFNNCTHLNAVNFGGSQSQWEAITIGARNEPLLNAWRVCINGTTPEFTIAVSQDYALISVGESIELTLEPESDTLAALVQWSSEDDDIAVVDNGIITGIAPGTTYITAEVTIDGTTQTCRCRVDVAEENAIQGVKLGTPDVTTELFRRDYAQIDVILLLNQSRTASAAGRSAPKNTGISIESARFENAQTAALFDLAVKDDRTLQIVPTEMALAENGIYVSAKSYTSNVILTIHGKEYMTYDALNIKVTKTLPKLKAEALNFNGFFTGQTLSAKIDGATVTGMQLDPAKSAAIPSWLKITGSDLSLGANAPAKGSVSVCALVETQEWAVPVPVTIPVKLTTAAPKLKLAPASAVFPAGNGYENCEGLPMQLVSSDKKVSLESLGISKVSAPWGFEIQDLDPVTGNFLLKPTRDVVAGNRSLTVSFAQSSKTVNLTLKLSTQAVKPKLSATSLKLNKAIGDMGVVTLTSQIPGYIFDEPTCTILRNKVSVPGELDIRWEDGKLLVGTNKKTIYGGSYQIQIQVKESAKPLTLKVTIPAQAKSAVTAKLTAKGKLDVVRDGTSIVITPKYTNYNGIKDLGAVLSVQRMADLSGNFWVKADELTVTPNEDGTFTITKVPGAQIDTTLKYRAALTFDGLPGTQPVYVKLNILSGTAKLTPAQAPVLYRSDRYSRADLLFTAADNTLNAVSNIAFKDTSLERMYQIYHYENGEFAIGFAENAVNSGVKSQKIPLYIYLDGNSSGKPNATVTVNLQIR